jgi:hypothetical protein
MGALKQQLHALQMAGSTASGGKENSGATCSVGPGPAGSAAAAAFAHYTQAPGGVVLQGQLCEAVQRLLRERELLLSSGAYAPDDPLVQRLDRRIKECAALAAPS